MARRPLTNAQIKDLRIKQQFAALPDKSVHPLRLLILKKGITLGEAAKIFGWSLRKLMWVVGEWQRPNDAEEIAAALGRDMTETFPRRARI